MPQRPPVRSRSGVANDIIALLRKAAMTTAELGDTMEDRLDAKDAEIDAHGAAAERAAERTAAFEGWAVLLADFRRGVVDADELIDHTIGRYGLGRID